MPSTRTLVVSGCFGAIPAGPGVEAGGGGGGGVWSVMGSTLPQNRFLALEVGKRSVRPHFVYPQTQSAAFFGEVISPTGYLISSAER